ncbi:hypothetical protein J5X98_10880 [Leptothermofonsia sichuanensis E412]|uniref:hypothetical protein n=1 Tax=Leptothermofonsia sichuanensis TaxID=2917832 RepID=UPI001CA79F5F|nr:hypothetical protein [Leptothermofonsia sichuanensis]QZZ22805.1 hypothetical protein J5X98_10880 [Leptothermofonsia sichuanensis E412]
MDLQGTWQGHKIEISSHLSPKYLFFASDALVKVDDKEVARFGGFFLRKRVLVSTFDHQGETIPIEIKLKSGLFLPSYLIRINEEIFMQGYCSPENISRMRIYFGVIGFVRVNNLILLAFPRYRDMISRIYDDPYEYVVGLIGEAIFGALFLYFAISLKSLLLNSLHFISGILYILIGIMIVTTPRLMAEFMQGTCMGSFSCLLRFGLLRLLFIWLFAYLLANCKQLSQELRNRP